MTVPKQEQASFLLKWITAVRPWSFPASTMPLIFGSSLAVVFSHVQLDALGSILVLLSLILLHSTANIISDIFDFNRGLDRTITPVSGAIVRGWITPRQAAVGAAVLYSMSAIFGVIAILRIGIILLIVGSVGVVIGLCYTFLKYRALGDLAVFLSFGLLGSLGGWVVQTHSFSWLPVFWAIPLAMLVSAILHANNWRDTPSDKQKKVITVAGLLGDKGSLVYYGCLIFGAVVFVVVLSIFPRIMGMEIRPMPYPFLITILALPKAMKLWKRATHRHTPKHEMDFITLDGATAQYNLVFGILCIAAAWIHYVVILI